MDIVQDVKTDEQFCLNNLPENLQNGDRYDAMEDVVDALDDAIDSIREAKKYIDRAKY